MSSVTAKIHNKPALDLMSAIGPESVDLIYTDPPFGTGNEQTMTKLKNGEVLSKLSYSDRHEDYLAFLKDHVVAMRDVLKNSGTLYLHLDLHWVHYAKVLCDSIFGRENFLNHVIWSYNYGGRGKTNWPQKHDDILVYAKSAGDHVFNLDQVDRIPYAAPEMQYVNRTKEEAEARIKLGQIPTDVWDIPIVGTNSKERLNYPNQKPVALIKRIITASSPIGGLVMDPFLGSGSTIEACMRHDRNAIGTDINGVAIDVMKKRFANRIEVQFMR